MKHVRKILIVLFAMVLLLPLVAVTAQAVTIRSFVGYSAFVVVSSSMEPVMRPGDVILVRQVDGREIEIGDDVTFIRDAQGTVVTHRVIAREVRDGTVWFTTQGVNNRYPDAPIPAWNVIGRVVCVLPRWIGWPLGRILMWF